MTTTTDVMLDTTPITTEITRLISTGTSEEALLTRSGAPVPELEPGRAVAGPAGRDGRGGAEGSAPTLKTATIPPSALTKDHQGLWWVRVLGLDWPDDDVLEMIGPFDIAEGADASERQVVRRH